MVRDVTQPTLRARSGNDVPTLAPRWAHTAHFAPSDRAPPPELETTMGIETMYRDSQAHY